MSIVEETRIALLELFPEQAAADAEARAAAEAKAEALAAKAAEEGGEETAPDAEPEVEADAVEPEAKEEPEEEGPRTNGVIQTDHAASGTDIDVLCDPDQVTGAAEIMDKAGFFLEAVSGVDWIKEDKMEVIYDYNQYGMDQCRVVVRAFISREDPEIPTISHILPAANWHERETWDFFGIKFTGHPNLIRILLPEDADFHPLLKDFKP
jgi:NADH-quinone oxidoreductase subunit C